MDINKHLEPYHARDRRVYNGALCTDMQKEADRIKYLEERLKKADHTARVTFFPAPGPDYGYLVSTNANLLDPNHKGVPKDVTGNFHWDKQDALIEAIEVLESNA